jgi:hypothetical protein
MNLYAYTGGDPVNYVDPKGLAYSLGEQRTYANFINSYEGFSTCVWECLYKKHPEVAGALVAAITAVKSNLKPLKELKSALKKKASPFTSVDKKHPNFRWSNPNGGVKRPAGRIQRLKPVGRLGTATAAVASFASGYIYGALGDCVTDCEQCEQ